MKAKILRLILYLHLALIPEPLSETFSYPLSKLGYLSIRIHRLMCWLCHLTQFLVREDLHRGWLQRPGVHELEWDVRPGDQPVDNAGADEVPTLRSLLHRLPQPTLRARSVVTVTSTALLALIGSEQLHAVQGFNGVVWGCTNQLNKAIFTAKIWKVSPNI